MLVVATEEGHHYALQRADSPQTLWKSPTKWWMLRQEVGEVFVAAKRLLARVENVALLAHKKSMYYNLYKKLALNVKLKVWISI